MLAINAFFLIDFIFTSFFTSPVGCEHNTQYGEPRDVKNRGFTANLNKRQAAELPQTKETHQWKV
jgi:hypothetical protein